MVTANKIDDNWVELTHLQRISKEDLISEKTTIELRLVRINELLGIINAK